MSKSRRAAYENTHVWLTRVRKTSAAEEQKCPIYRSTRVCRYKAKSQRKSRPTKGQPWLNGRAKTTSKCLRLRHCQYCASETPQRHPEKLDSATSRAYMHNSTRARALFSFFLRDVSGNHRQPVYGGPVISNSSPSFGVLYSNRRSSKIVASDHAH